MFGQVLASLSNFLGRFAVMVMVSPWEQAIRVRAGRHVARLAPGFHLLIPVVDVVHRQTVRRRNSMIPTQTLTTADGHTLIIGASLGYEIADIEQLYRTLHDADDTLVQMAAAAIADAVQATPRGELRPRAAGERLTGELSRELGAFGLGGVQLRITDFGYIRAFRLVQDQRWGMGRGLQLGGAGQ